MKLIESSVQIIEEKDPYKMIELAGRTCYKSEDKITENSAKEFVDRMIKLGHGAMLEHGTIYLKIDKTEDGHLPPARLYWSDGNHKKYTRVRKHGNSIYVTTNLRVIVENNRLDDLQYQVEPTEHHEKRITAKFICDRGVSHEFVRHRVLGIVIIVRISLEMILLILYLVGQTYLKENTQIGIMIGVMYPNLNYFILKQII